MFKFKHTTTPITTEATHMTKAEAFARCREIANRPIKEHGTAGLPSVIEMIRQEYTRNYKVF